MTPHGGHRVNDPGGTLVMRSCSEQHLVVTLELEAGLIALDVLGSIHILASKDMSPL